MTRRPRAVRQTWLATALVVLAAAVPPAQEGGAAKSKVRVPPHGVQGFTRLLHRFNLQPVASFDALEKVDPRETVIILFGDPAPMAGCLTRWENLSRRAAPSWWRPIGKPASCSAISRSRWRATWLLKPWFGPRTGIAKIAPSLPPACRRTRSSRGSSGCHDRPQPTRSARPHSFPGNSRPISERLHQHPRHSRRRPVHYGE